MNDVKRCNQRFFEKNNQKDLGAKVASGDY